MMRIKLRSSTFWLFCMMWSSTIFIPLIKEAIGRIPLIGAAAPIIVGLAWGVAILVSLSAIIKKLKFADVFFFLIAMLVVCLNLVFSNQFNAAFEKYWTQVLFICIPCFFIGKSIELDWFTDRKNDKYKKLLILTYINVIADMLFFFSYSGGISAEQLYQSASTNVRYTSFMFFAYALLPHLLFVGYDFILTKRITSLGVAVICFVVMLGQGTRGAVLCVLVFIAMVCLRKFAKTSLSLKLLIAFLSITAIAMVSNTNIINSIAVNLQSMLYKAGLSTRTLDSFLQLEYIGDSGRSLLNASFFDSIKQLPLFGYGLMGDVGLAGTYSHNIFMEIIIEFGLPLGTLIGLSIIIILFRTFSSICDERYYIMSVFFCTGFVKLLVSGTYLTDIWFFFLIGACVRIGRDKKLGCGQEKPFSRRRRYDFSI